MTHQLLKIDAHAEERLRKNQCNHHTATCAIPGDGLPAARQFIVYSEAFESTIGKIHFYCFRSPRKEARILKLAAGHPNFMKGFAVYDAKGNVVRVIDRTTARRLPPTSTGSGQTMKLITSTLSPGCCPITWSAFVRSTFCTNITKSMETSAETIF